MSTEIDALVEPRPYSSMIPLWNELPAPVNYENNNELNNEHRY